MTFISADLTKGSAALYSLIGFLVVLAVLALLVGVFYLSGYIFSTKAMSVDKPFEREKKEKTSEDAASDEDEETVAAITAAISLMLEDEGDKRPEFIIRRIRRK